MRTAEQGGGMDACIRDRTLQHVLDNLAPLRFLLVPLILLVGTVMDDDLQWDRVAVWLAASCVATLAIVTACEQARAAKAAGSNVVSRPLLGLAVIIVGASAGLSTWVPAPGETEVVLLFSLFPSVSFAVGAVVCAGRRDMFFLYAAPLVAIESGGLWATGDGRLRALAIINLGYAVIQTFLHHAVSRSLLSSLRHELTTQSLAGQLAADQAALTDAYEQLRATNDQLVHLALHDPLTGLLNRRGTLETLDALLDRRGTSARRTTSLLFIDVDRFKAVNDLLGHRGGDRLLSVLADRIRRTLDTPAVAGRIGGDEFVVVLPDHDVDQAAAVAARLVTVLAQPIHAAEGRALPTSVSVGVAAAPREGCSSSDLLRDANAALYRAKRNGRNRVEVFDVELQTEVQGMLEAEHALRRAIDHGEILSFFQPEVDATTGRVVGAEVLARWLRDDGTMVSAVDFIAIARKAGLLERLTERVLAQARPDIRRMASIGLPEGFRFRINLAPSTTDGSWSRNPIDELVRGIDPNLLTVDVRESAIVGDVPGAAATLASFRARGGRVCLDDFARGVSSLSLLRKLPIDEVRVDRAAIDTITAHPHDRAIVRSIIAVVREIGLSVTADGVETGSQADTLIALGCIRHQGHLYSRALSAERFEAYLVDRQAEGYVVADHAQHEWSTDGLS
ncbi:MAG: EAL domain-containing protein [Actinobacteria bacterium]|nr:EAL domain-containing protein [Actinomycetota bacterium]